MPILTNKDEPTTVVPNVTADFIHEKFCRDDGEFDEDKARTFANELRQRRETLQQQVHDTRYSERILRDVYTHRDALKNAHKKSTFGGGNVLQGLDKAVIPQADAIVEMIAQGAPTHQITKAAEAFVRVYSPYEMPNPVVTYWNTNNQVYFVPMKMITAWSRRKDTDNNKKANKEALEAVNLDVEEPEHIQEVSRILEKDIESGYRLSIDETKTLKAQSFDLSQLNPGSTAFWSRPTPENLAKWNHLGETEYPTAEEKVIYQAPRYRSKFSTKMTGYVWRNGDKHRFKIKLGQEVHSEIIVGKLREFMGFKQDHMRHYPRLKMYLGDKSYAQWERDLQVKYGTEQLRRHVLQRGQDEKTGEDWVVFRDCAIEARPKSQVRVSAVDYGSYDGARQREVRASAMIYAFFAQGDHSTKNTRQVLVQDEDGDYHVEHRMHDVGTALGRSPVLLRGPRDILNFPMSKNKPEEYDRNYVWADKDGNVSFIWNDYWHHIRDHSGATFSDFKWAARLIGSLTIDEITDAVVTAGIPEDLVGPYVYHITNMRNRAVRAFWLEPGEASVPGRGPIQLDEATPPTTLIRADGYQVIKKGKIVGNYYQNSTILPLLQETWFTKINSMLSGRSIGRDIGSHYVEASFMPLVRLDTHVGRQLWEREVPWTMTTFSVGIGLNATVARIVQPNRLYSGSEGRSRAYVVRDTLAFSVGVGFPAVSSALARLGPELSVSAQLYQRRFQHIHFAETVSEGYRSPVHVHKITKLGNIESLAVTILTPGDVLREYRAIGATSAAHAGLGFTAPYIGIGSVGSSLSFQAGQMNWQTVSYTKDQVGSLHLLLENDNEGTLGAQTEQFNVSASALGSAAAFALGGHRARVNYDVWNIEVAPKAYDMDNATEGVSRTGPEAEELIAILKTLRRHPHLAMPENRKSGKLDLPDNIKLRFHAKADKKESRSNAQLLYLLNHDRKKEKTNFSIETDDYEYKFFSKSRAKRGYAGIEKTVLDFDTKNSVIREGTSKRLTVEMDRQNPRSLVVWVDVFDYHRSLDRPRLLKLIDSLNQRYNNPDDDSVFFVQPPMASKDPYKRVYANARIYVNGDKLIKLVQNMEVKEIMQHLTAVKYPLRMRNKRKFKAALQELTKAVDGLNKLTEDDDEKHTHKVQDRLAMAAMRLVNALYQSNTWGVSYLHQLLGVGGMLVVGEVFGINDRSNMLQDPDWVSRLRFAGKSWGKLTNVPPVSRFVRVDQPTPANEHAMLDIPMERFLGTIVTGYDGGWVGLGSR